MKHSSFRIEYVEITGPRRRFWFGSIQHSSKVHMETLGEIISNKSNELRVEGWYLSNVQIIPRSDWNSPRVRGAAWLSFVESGDRSVDNVALDPSGRTDEQEFAARMESAFSTIYMTITSIVQGVVLAIVAQQTFGFITVAGVSNIEVWASILPYVALSLLFVVTVAFDYSSLIGIYRWTPRLTDVIFPFGLGFAQIGAAYFLTNPRAWWMTNAVLAGIGALAFHHTTFRTNREMTEFPDIVEYTRATNRRSLLLSAAVVVLSVLAALFYSEGRKIGYWYLGDLIPTGVYLIALIALLWTQDRDISPGMLGPYRSMSKTRVTDSES